MITINGSEEEKTAAEAEEAELWAIDVRFNAGNIQRPERNRLREGVIFRRNLKEAQDEKDKKAREKEMEKLKAESPPAQGRRDADELLALTDPEPQDDEIVLTVVELRRTGRWDMLPDKRKIIDGMTPEQRGRVEELTPHGMP